MGTWFSRLVLGDHDMTCLDINEGPILPERRVELHRTYTIEEKPSIAIQATGEQNQVVLFRTLSLPFGLVGANYNIYISPDQKIVFCSDITTHLEADGTIIICTRSNQYPGRTLVSLWQAHLPEFLFAVRWLNENIQIREDGAVRFDEGMWIEKLISPPKPTLGQIYQ